MFDECVFVGVELLGQHAVTSAPIGRIMFS